MVNTQNGLTIIELMVVLLIAGIVGSFALDAIIDHRCEHDPSSTICVRKPLPPTQPGLRQRSG